MHHQPIVPDHSTKYEENLSGHHRGMHEDIDRNHSYIPDSAIVERGIINSANMYILPAIM